jgi:biopolymer transport protein ExbD
MLRRPTSRRKSNPEEIELNLVPVLDTMVTLIAFLLFTMSFMSLASIESPFPIASPKDVEQKIKEKPLQLTLTVRDKEVQLWSPFDVIPAQVIPHTVDGTPDVAAVHQALLGIKAQRPTETRIIFVPQASSNYDTLVALMDGARVIDKGDAPIYFKNPATGQEEVAKMLFPEIVFGNLLGDL